MRFLRVAVVMMCSVGVLAQTSRIDLKLDSSEAHAALAILNKEAAKQAVSDSDWQRLFQTEPYVRLKKREAAMKRPFTDDDFKEFLLSADMVRSRDALGRTLAQWEKADLNASANRVLAYLPSHAVIRAKVYPVIKPRKNSFVFETDTDPAIFLYLDPTVSPARFENTVAHELHHIGLSSTGSSVEDVTKRLPANIQSAVQWMSAFGEGEAMLAAAGGADVDPEASAPPEERAWWQQQGAQFNANLLEVQKFFESIVGGNFNSSETIRDAGFKFFGDIGKQGPWYTVGYRMAVMVERRYGRAALIECMLDPRKLLTRYNVAARAWNQAHPDQKLELWSSELLKKVEAPPAPDEPVGTL